MNSWTSDCLFRLKRRLILASPKSIIFSIRLAEIIFQSFRLFSRSFSQFVIHSFRTIEGTSRLISLPRSLLWAGDTESEGAQVSCPHGRHLALSTLGRHISLIAVSGWFHLFRIPKRPPRKSGRSIDGP